MRIGDCATKIVVQVFAVLIAEAQELKTCLFQILGGTVVLKFNCHNHLEERRGQQ